jgi:hypothetical protein
MYIVRMVPDPRSSLDKKFTKKIAVTRVQSNKWWQLVPRSQRSQGFKNSSFVTTISVFKSLLINNAVPSPYKLLFFLLNYLHDTQFINMVDLIRGSWLLAMHIPSRNRIRDIYPHPLFPRLGKAVFLPTTQKYPQDMLSSYHCCDQKIFYQFPDSFPDANIPEIRYGSSQTYNMNFGFQAPI